MIHDIGSLIIYKTFPAKAKVALILCNELGKDLILSEQKVLGFDHAQLGASLTLKWNLSKVIQETTQFHHQPLDAPTYKVESAIVHLADYIIQSNQLGSSGEVQPSNFNQDVLKYLDLSIETVALISEETIQRFDEIYKDLST